MNRFNIKTFMLGAVCASAVFVAVGWRGAHMISSGGGAAAAAICCSETGSHVYAADLDGIYVSKDYGKTWVKKTP